MLRCLVVLLSCCLIVLFSCCLLVFLWFCHLSCIIVILFLDIFSILTSLHSTVKPPPFVSFPVAVLIFLPDRCAKKVAHLDILGPTSGRRKLHFFFCTSWILSKIARQASLIHGIVVILRVASASRKSKLASGKWWYNQSKEPGDRNWLKTRNECRNNGRHLFEFGSDSGNGWWDYS